MNQMRCLFAFPRHSGKWLKKSKINWIHVVNLPNETKTERVTYHQGSSQREKAIPVVS